MAEWLKAADCKSVHASVRRFESYSLHHFFSLFLLNFKEKLVVYRNSQGFDFVDVLKWLPAKSRV